MELLSQHLSQLVDGALIFFLGRITFTVVINRHMFYPRYGRGHRLLGLLMLVHLSVGLADARFGKVVPPSMLWIYDATLSCIGLSVSFSAAREFGPAHSRVRNEASGVLDEKASVTVAEMLEHCFYQGLNLVQILFLHLLPLLRESRVRVALALAATLPWLRRDHFPVNSFSANYTSSGVGGSTWLIRTLYRLKKYQYLLYKHFLLHGLNASAAVDGPRWSADGLVCEPYFRMYWLCLNIAYVSEFFMQTLVKRGYMSQSWMLALQQALVFAVTLAALRVLQSVRLLLALLSLALNCVRRGREVSNMALVLLAARTLPPIDHLGGLFSLFWD